MRDIIIYKTDDNSIEVQVQFDGETVWLTQTELVSLFERDQSVISRHVNNVFKELELDKKSNMQKMHIANSDKPVAFYSLDVIISVGYRVKSKRGTQFRIWANRVLKQHLVKGFTANKTRLAELKQSVKLIQDTVNSEALESNQTAEIVKVLADYALGLEILDGYDHQNIEVKETNPITQYEIDYQDAIDAIQQLRLKFGGSILFGNEKDDSFRSSISTINQTYDGEELYPSLEEKAANLLYFVVKNHSFSDGNKRIAAWLFVWYLNKNKYLYDEHGKQKIANNALASITLMVALSRPEEKELMIKVIINAINNLNKGY